MIEKKLTAGAKAWCWICLVASISYGVVFTMFIMFFSEGYYVNVPMVALAAVMVAVGYLAFTGYIILLAGKRLGFYWVCATGVLGVLAGVVAALFGSMQGLSPLLAVGFLATNAAAIIFSLLGPLVTWRLIHSNWRRWPEIDAANKQQMQYMAMQAANAPAEAQQAAWQLRQYYRKRGRGMKIWAIVNTCFFFMFVTPIVAIVYASKAQNANDEASFQKYRRIARILNIVPYALMFLMAIVNGIVTQLSS